MTGACIYTRFSPRPKEKAEECDSIEKQRERCEAYCKANDYTVLAVYEEPEVSGGRADNRPQLQAALDQVCKEKATLVVYTLDRLARNVDDARAISKRLEKAGANLAILQMRVDTTTPYGKLFFTIVAAFAEFYREDIAQRTSKAMLRHQAHGRRMTRTDYCPYGKMPDRNGPMHEASDENGNKVLRPTQLVDCPEEQAVIDRICLEREQGKGLREIARLLDAEGITCRGRRWHHSTIKTILSRIGGDVGRAA
jgi:DNA invertase Pin-like site-specific DNA recombinase